MKPLNDDTIRKDNYSTYVVATRSNSFLAKAIRWFSARRSMIDEYDHIVMVRYGLEAHMTTPRATIRPWQLRPYQDVFIVLEGGQEAWNKATEIAGNGNGYGRLQLLSKAFTMLWGWKPFTAKRDCIEFVLEAIIEPKPDNADSLTVGQGVNLLFNHGFMRYVGSIVNTKEEGV